MNKEELKNQIIELKENCKKLVEEYRERYNQDNENKIALNMFYHNVISYNDYESVLALIENRNSMMMCFSNPPILTEETVEVDIKRIGNLEKENAELENDYKLIDKSREHLVQEKYNLEYKIENLENKIEHHQEVINTLQKKNAELSEKLNRHKHDCPNCSAFGKHCPHKVNGDPYTYDCYLTVAELEKENAELRKIANFQQSSNMSRYFENNKLKEGLAVGSTFNKALNSMNKNLEEERDKYRNMVFDKDEQLTKAKEFLKRLLITSCNSDVLNLLPNCSEVLRVRVEAEQFLSEVEK